MGAVPGPFLAKWSAYAQHLGSPSAAALCVSAGSLAILLLWPKISRRIPGPIVAIVLATAAVAVFQIPVETIGSRFGDIRAALPSPRLPAFSVDRVRELFPSTVTVALLAAIESLLSAVVADGMIGTRHKSNMARCTR
jgi:sulfate permease, SulP family